MNSMFLLEKQKLPSVWVRPAQGWKRI